MSLSEVRGLDNVAYRAQEPTSLSVLISPDASDTSGGRFGLWIQPVDAALLLLHSV
jgi:hypothetical protein